MRADVFSDKVCNQTRFGTCVESACNMRMHPASLRRALGSACVAAELAEVHAVMAALLRPYHVMPSRHFCGSRLSAPCVDCTTTKRRDKASCHSSAGNTVRTCAHTRLCVSNYNSLVRLVAKLVQMRTCTKIAVHTVKDMQYYHS